MCGSHKDSGNEDGWLDSLQDVLSEMNLHLGQKDCKLAWPFPVRRRHVKPRIEALWQLAREVEMYIFAIQA